ncbi:CheR family methyltransferase [Oceanicoccus sagamiensis]|uniref:protein-glutamate O-methyltransferase n=1 Tax=Oceanicoccus sagamiensis TaxID=716816 RepID=A0A1X9N7F9_9GAMM|nr:protein-glutamate O-methyltransferase CheR [Oceanicoccus sagamiensis]ARN73064.1 chemotaxis protein [Oceanicoccus sagamiensis]
MVASSPADYQVFRDFLEDACGILLGENKQYLVSSRLSKLMAEHDIETLSDLVKSISQISNRRLKDKVVDAMTTNETLWFRDTHPFDIFKNRLLPEYQDGRKGAFRIWCAACSSGQEPYSLSMLTEEYRAAKMGSLKNPVEIVATDLSPSMLEQCKLGEYDSLSLGRGLSPERLKRFFDQADGGVWRVKPELRKPIKFSTRNLLDSFATMGKFDVVFCRNVLIYFSADLKLDILRRIHASLRPGGYLVLGASEGLSGVKDYYEMVQCHPGIIYRAI